MKRFAKIATFIAAFWFAFYLGFSIERLKCVPLLADKCLDQDWKSFGDAVLLGWVSSTLVAGSLAIVAAFVGGLFITRQIQQTELIEQERLRRRHSAARAVLPLALSSIIEYAIASTVSLLSLHQTIQDGKSPYTNPPPPFPNVPDGAITLLRDMIESSNEAIGTPIASLLSKLEDHSSQLRYMQNRLRNQSGRHLLLNIHVEGDIIASAAIYALTETIFKYARGATDTISSATQWDSIRQALANMNVFEQDFARLYRFLEHSEKNNSDP